MQNLSACTNTSSDSLRPMGGWQQLQLICLYDHLSASLPYCNAALKYWEHSSTSTVCQHATWSTTKYKRVYSITPSSFHNSRWGKLIITDDNVGFWGYGLPGCNECQGTIGFSFRASSIRVTIRITNRCDFLYYVFISFFSSFPYMFRAFMSPSSGAFQAVVFMLPFGSCSALLIHGCGSLSPRHGASSGCGWRNGLLYGG